MLSQAGVNGVDPSENLRNGKAMDKWRQMISAQGGNPDAELPKARHSHQILATESGFVSRLDALEVGVASWRLGAGRERKEDAVQFGAGVVLNVQIGSRIEAGQPLMTLFTDTDEKFDRAIELAGGAVEISSSSVAQRKLILGRIS